MNLGWWADSNDWEKSGSESNVWKISSVFLTKNRSQNHSHSTIRLLREHPVIKMVTKSQAFVTQYLRPTLHKWRVTRFWVIRKTNLRLWSDQSHQFCLQSSQIWTIFDSDRVPNPRFQPKVINAETLEKFSERTDFHFLTAFFTFLNQVSEIDFRCRICFKTSDFVVIQTVAAR